MKSCQNSLMERSLRQAKDLYLLSLEQKNNVEHANRLVGINDEVVSEVGHEIGDFEILKSDPAILQGAAAYLRSQAPSGVFDSITSMSSFLHSESSKYDSLLEMAYAESGEVTSAFGCRCVQVLVAPDHQEPAVQVEPDTRR